MLLAGINITSTSDGVFLEQIIAGVNIFIQVTNETYRKGVIKRVNSLIKQQQKRPKYGLKYHKLDNKSPDILFFSDGSFSQNNNEWSQVRYIILIAHRNKNRNIIDF